MDEACIANLPFNCFVALNRMEFDSQRWIRHIKEPILILHAMDDATIPYELGDDLH